MIIFLELKRRGYSVYVGISGNGEIDFVPEKQITVYLKNTQRFTSKTRNDLPQKHVIFIVFMNK